MPFVTVHAEFIRADATPAAGTVQIWPYLDAVRSDPDPELVTRARLTGELDSSGIWEEQVLPSDAPEWHADGPVPYMVKWHVTGSYGERIVVIPAPGPWSLWELVDIADPTVVPVPIPGPPGPSAVSADAGNIAELGSDELIYVPAVAGGGVTDHGLLTGLADDDHTQYLTNARGDARYDALGAATGAVAAHEAAADPHPVYLTTVEGAAAYAPVAHSHTAAAVGADPAGTADAAVAAHAEAADPHTAYLKPAEVLAGANITVDTATTPGSVIITGAAGGGGGGGAAPIFQPGRWNASLRVAAGPVASGWIILGRLYAIDFPTGKAVTVTAVSINQVAAADATVSLRLGLFADSNGLPGALVEQTTVAATAGYKTWTLTTPYAVTGERFWILAGPQGTGAIGTVWMSSPSAAGFGPNGENGATFTGPAHSGVSLYHTAAGVLASNPAMAYDGTAINRFPHIMFRTQ